ncbi:MAG: hypothetical protein ACMUHB_03490 [Thermoplasmatota archaeon]
MRKATPLLWKVFSTAGPLAFILLSSLWYLVDYYPEIPSNTNILLTLLFTFSISLAGLMITFCIFKTIDNRGIFFREDIRSPFMMKRVEDLRSK